MTAQFDFGPKLAGLAEAITRDAETSARMLVALAGPPAAGKSTLSEALCDAINDRAGDGTAVVVPMDGYHLDNRILEAQGLLPRKGAPQTFDVDGFISLVKRLRIPGSDIYYPLFDRSRDIAIAGAGMLSGNTPVVILEGNYLLCREAPWNELHSLVDKTVFVSASKDVLEARLISRWLENGLEPDAARERALSNDIPNALFVVDTAIDADTIVVSGEAG